MLYSAREEAGGPELRKMLSKMTDGQRAIGEILAHQRQLIYPRMRLLRAFRRPAPSLSSQGTHIFPVVQHSYFGLEP